MNMFCRIVPAGLVFVVAVLDEYRGSNSHLMAVPYLITILFTQEYLFPCSTGRVVSYYYDSS